MKLIFNHFQTIHEAIGYADFIEKRLVEKEYFQALDFKFQHAWSILLWYNYLNHGGSRVIIEDGEILENEDEPELSLGCLRNLKDDLGPFYANLLLDP